jgi:hypothetical protein
MLNHLKKFTVAASLVAFGLGVLPAQVAAQPAASTAYGPTGYATVPLYAGLLGSYSKGLTSGTIAAGQSANAPIFSFRYGPGGTSLAVIRSIVLAASSLGTGFTAGTATCGVVAARAFTASDTGGTAGTITGNNAKMRTSFATTGVTNIQVANTAALTAGTRTLDSDPLASTDVAIGTGTNTQFINPGTALYLPTSTEYPLTLANNEGFEVQCTVPATGTWNVTVSVSWDEYTAY